MHIVIVEDELQIRQELKVLLENVIQNGIQVEIDCKDHVCTDRKWIAFILNQILQNSLKYRRETDARIRICTEKESKGVRLVIEDNGVGKFNHSKLPIFLITNCISLISDSIF